MRRLMHEIVKKTKFNIKYEVDRLQHKDELSPEKVIERAMSVGDHVLFPSLSSKFLMKEVPRESTEQVGPASELAAAALLKDGSSSFSRFMSSKDKSREKSDSDSPILSKSLNQPLSLSSQPAMLFDPISSSQSFESAASFVRATTAPHPHKLKQTASSRSPERKGTAGHNGLGNNEKAPLPLQLMSKQNMVSVLDSAKAKLEKMEQEPEPDLPRQKKAASKTHRTLSAQDKFKSTSSGSATFTPGFSTEQSSIMKDFSSLPHFVSIVGEESGSGFAEGLDMAAVFEDDVEDSAGNHESGGQKAGAGASKDSVQPPTTSARAGTAASRVQSAASSVFPTVGEDGQLISNKQTFLPHTEDEFRREFSPDHPLAGGTGRYSKEKSKGKDPAGATSKRHHATVEKLVSPLKGIRPEEEKDIRRQLEKLRREQNEALLKVLEEERKAEEQRERAGKLALSTEERTKLEFVFAEERRKASERIIQITKENEDRIKKALLTMDTF